MACGRTIRNPADRFASLRRRATALAGFVALILALAAPAQAGALKTSLTVTVNDGYARLVFTAGEYLDATARVAGNVLIINFNQPIDVSVDQVAEKAPDYIGAARRDPDGKAVRMALARTVTLNSIGAGEKFFVDLLPDTWSGTSPGLPQDVVKELTRRARAADQVLQREREKTQQTKVEPVRVHVATQPTFTRYVFGISDKVAVSADRAKDRLILNFDTPLVFDLADAQAAMPKVVEDISSELDEDSALVRFIFNTKADLRSFRDENGYVVDVLDPGAAADQAAQSPAGQQPGAMSEAALTKKLLQDAVAAPNAAAAKPAPPSVDAPATIAAQSPQPAAAVPAAPPTAAPPPAVAPAAQPVSPRAPPVQSSPGADPTPQPATQNAAPVTAKSDGKDKTASKELSTNPAKSDAAKADTTKSDAAKSEPAAAAEVPAPAAPASAATAPSAPAAKAIKPPGGGEAKGMIGVEVVREGATLKLSFPFAAATGAAVFHRADTLWLVFDSKADFDLSAIDGDPARTVRSYEFVHTADAAVLRLKLDRPHLSSVSADGAVWTVQIGDTVPIPTRALEIARNVIGPNRSSVTIPFDAPQHLHRITDPEAGDSLFVVTALGPARGFINEQDFIEFRALASTEGVVIEPLADDIAVDLAADKILVGRPNGLTLSTSLQTLLHGSGLRPVMFDSQIWGYDRQASYVERQSHLIDAAAVAPQNKKLVPRIELARFYLARDMYPEAKGVLDVALMDDHRAAESVSAVVLRAVAEVMMNRPEAALKDLADSAVGDQHDAPLWRSLAYARQGKWGQAREGFKVVEATIATLPIELQRVALKDEMRSAIEVGDFDGASTDLNDFETIGVPHDMEPVIAVLMGRLAEGMGRTEDALAAYRTAADSWDRPAAAQGLLREIVLRYSMGDLKREPVISQLESLTTVWRGDETEIEALKILAHLYTEDGRYRDAFYVMRSAMAARPDSAMTRQIQDEAAVTFDSLFLAGKGDAMPAIDALALFYDFRELTPVGNRGDEMIRRLADRLVSIDLLDQAADLLQYQVDHRLQGAARAQVATRLAVIYLMNQKADRALATLRATRVADLSNDLRNQRLLLEGRALSDLGRRDLALEIIANISGREAIRLRSDILWAARRWGEAAEQIELMYGERYKDFQPLTEIERQDILRAEIGYALAEDKLGLGRFRDKYAAKMAQTPDARDFDIVSAPLGSSGAEFAAIAHAATSVDTLEAFLRDIKARYPDAVAGAPAGEPALPTTSSQSGPAASARPSDAPPAAPALSPPPAKAAGHTAAL
jgi:tetratricopeptide (TPR) repeat protein